jgi:DNA polymerase-3 subunit gamma/tau
MMSADMSSNTNTGTDDSTKEQSTPADPDAQTKIERHREKFLAKLTAERPRMGVAYETMEMTGNTLRVMVASATLRDEVLRHRTETLQLLAAVAGVHGSIELEVIVDENVKPVKPIRIEDKLRHLIDNNPDLITLRRTLDMEIE